MKRDLEGVKVGEKLICPRGRGGGFNVYTVTRLTATLAVCGDRATFALKDGKRRGTNGWNTQWARIPTPEQLERIEKDLRVERVQFELSRIKVTHETLEEVESLVTHCRLMEKKKEAAQ